VILVDAGPLKALIDATDSSAARCTAVLQSLRDPMMTTEPALTEACYLLQRDAGALAAQPVLRLVCDGRLLVASLDLPMWSEAARLMAKYADLPMDLADASLVVVASKHSIRRVFTLDSHFRSYRVSDGSAFDILPEDV